MVGPFFQVYFVNFVWLTINLTRHFLFLNYPFFYSKVSNITVKSSGNCGNEKIYMYMYLFIYMCVYIYKYILRETDYLSTSKQWIF